MFSGQSNARNWGNINRQQHLGLHAAQSINQFIKETAPNNPAQNIIQPSQTILVYLVGTWCVHITSTIGLLMAVWHGINLAGAL